MTTLQQRPTNIGDWSTEQLKAEYEACYSTVYQVECYGKSDLITMSSVAHELERRGYTPRIVERVEWDKDDDYEYQD